MVTVPAQDDRRVVLCEDQGLIVYAIERALERAGYEVVGSARDVEQAVQLARNTHPAVVLMDMDPDGESAFQAARDILTEFSTCVVFISSVADRAVVDAAMDAGAAAIICKPFGLESLAPTLSEVRHRSRGVPSRDGETIH